MKQEIRYMISDAAKRISVESHVLRYWEDELRIPIKRNELGHRYYTEEDVQRFQEIKALKEQGLQLKAIRMILKNGKLAPLEELQVKRNTAPQDKPTGQGQSAIQVQPTIQAQGADQTQPAIQVQPTIQIHAAAQDQDRPQDLETKRILVMNNGEIIPVQEENKETKSIRLQQLLQQMISEAVRTNNKELCEEIKESMLKEMDYQFRLQEEREEEWVKQQINRDEQHYQRIDELLRKRNKKEKKAMPEKGTKVKGGFWARKKHSTS